ncbi:hypothetical protein HB779_08085 [Phyllobacterium sp. 628]|uniref:hypothetical protein n=1 Tax=Phyllobacterium sp. 628 TaxID=2718938 RepID=UPI001662543C|nr:hypothetical protein [Phyllobacterium sp. 628]QND51865.1 hypothetical protein HB779_08085 [Phyllobacterium sp. 628]
MSQDFQSKRRVAMIVLAILTIIALLPLFSVLTTYMLATALGCSVDEGSVHPCLMAGLDIGDLLYTMGVMGWLMIPAAPLLLIAVLGWIAVGVVSIVRHLHRD